MKRLDAMAPDEVQRDNREWWMRNIMPYGWKDAVGSERFSARYYLPEQFEDLFRGFFRDAFGEVMGQDADAVPPPRFLRRLALPFFPKRLTTCRALRDALLFVRARNPF